MKYLAVLGRQPKISMAELEALYGNVSWLGGGLAIFDTEKKVSIDRLGGSLKLAREIAGTPLDYLIGLPEGKITLGVSDYAQGATTRTANQEALKLKKILSRHGRSVRVLQSATPVLSTATAHHNQIGMKPKRVELIRTNKRWYVTVGVQNITAYAERDQARPARDAKVGMLPPKLAQILINLCGDLEVGKRVLDPFCGTGVVLQEAFLMGYQPYGSDLNPRMVEYAQKNMSWLEKAGRKRTGKGDEKGAGRRDEIERREEVAEGSEKAKKGGALLGGDRLLTKIDKHDIIEGDAVSCVWKQQIDAVACETYLGPPMSLAPVEIKLKDAKAECRRIIVGFLKNIGGQVSSGTPLALAVPSWLRVDGSYSGLNLLDEVDKLGYNVVKFDNVDQSDLLYHREGQVVAREIIVLRKK